jgi:hypothetical protein
VLPDEARARSLRHALKPIGVKIEAVDGHYELSVEPTNHNAESRVVNALSVIDHWLTTGDLPFVQVHLDGTVYTITSAAGAPQSQRAAPEDAGFNPGAT